MSLKLSDDQEEMFREAFNLFDKDGSGKIDTDEIIAAMAKFGYNPSQTELKEMMESADIHDSDGEISFEEFCAMMSKRVQEENIEKQLGRKLNADERESMAYMQKAILDLDPEDREKIFDSLIIL